MGGSDSGQATPAAEPTVQVGDTGRGGAAQAQPLAAGDTLDRYRILGELGRGGMGFVYRAHDPELDREIALKVVKTRSGMDASQGDVRMLREAQAMAQLNHPNVVPIYAVGTHEGRLFIAMELVRGQTVAKWLETEPSVAQILRVFSEAAKGLMGAHRAGIIHRDFKPSNILLGEDERVRVMDFGLARVAGSVDSPQGSVSLEDDPKLTQRGIVMGSPAYMPPEQHVGREIDVAADQYAFCASLWSALFGLLPFSGPELYAEKRRGPPPVPKGVVPRRVGRALQRGLSPDPGDRWPSMDALTQALQPSRPRRRWAFAAAAVASAGVGAWWGWPDDAASPCADAEDQLAGVWDGPTRQDIRSAITRGSATYAVETADFVEDRLDAYATEWAGSYTQACEDLASEDPAVARTAELRLQCLRVRRAGLVSMSEVLSQADEGTVRAASSAVTKLRPARACDEAQQLRGVPPPADPFVADEVERLRSLREKIETQARLVDGRKSLTPLLDELLDGTAAVDYPPLHAEVLQLQADLVHADGELEEAVELYERAHAAAVAAGSDALAAEAAGELVYVLAYQTGRAAHARTWLRELESRVERMGNGPREREQVWRAEAVLAHGTGDSERAEGFHRKILALHEELDGLDSFPVATTLTNLGAALFELQRYAEAKECFERAYQIFESARGGQHPDTGVILTSLGNATWMLGDRDRAVEYHRDSVQILESALGPDHVELALPLANLALGHSYLGRHEQAVSTMSRALAIQRAAMGESNRVVARSENTLGQIFARKGDLRSAKIHYQRGLDIAVASAGEDSDQALDAHRGLGRALLEEGDVDGAVEHLRQCVDDPNPSRAEDCREQLATATERAGH